MNDRATMYVTLPPEIAEKLAELARQEQRAPRRQAVVILTQGIEREWRAAKRRAASQGAS